MLKTAFVILDVTVYTTYTLFALHVRRYLINLIDICPLVGVSTILYLLFTQVLQFIESFDCKHNFVIAKNIPT